MITLASSAGWLGWFGWDTGDLPILSALPFLLLASGLFSGSETALFGLSGAQRMSIRHGASRADRAVDALLDDQRALLITILLANTTVNVLYFVMTSVLLMHSTAPSAEAAAMGATFLIVIVLAGEMLPKMLASAARMRCATLCATPLLAFHRGIGPLRIVLSRGVIAPLSRLAAPTATPAALHDEELKALLELSGAEGIIDEGEQIMLQEVLELSRLKVRDVMTPRVRMAALPVHASREDVVALVESCRLTAIPVYGASLDDIVGMLQVKDFLLDDGRKDISDPAVLANARFVPDAARLEQLLDLFRRWGARSAIVVDEYGGTEGVVSVEDVVEEFVGDIVAGGDLSPRPPRLVGLGRWEVSGRMSVYDWAEAFNEPLAALLEVSTLGGLITVRLGRAPHPGDAVDFERVRVEVESVERRRVITATVSLRHDSDEDDQDDAGDDDVPREGIS